MKNLILAATMMVSALGSHAQEKQSNTIQVGGVAKIEREVETYMIDFAVAVDYGELESRKPYEDLKKSFFAKVKEAGLNESQFEEDKMGYVALQLYREGGLYTFKTTSRDELMKASKLANGTIISITATRVKFKPVPKDAKTFETAVQDSKEKATLIAKAINKKLGDVVMVTDLTTQETTLEENFYYKQGAEQYVYLSVYYSIE